MAAAATKLVSTRTLRQMLSNNMNNNNGAALSLPGVFNGLTALAAQQAGFGACYIGGSTVTATTGQPDIGMVGLDGFCRVIKEVHSATGLPILADADTGFGEEEMMTKTALEYYRSGAAGMHIEDQVFPKRCGHLGGKSLVEKERMIAKIDRAVSARNKIQEHGGDFIVCARTDARSVSGLDESIERGIAYAEAGADMIFPEGLQNKEEFRLFAEAMEGYRSNKREENAVFLLANMTEFGQTEMISVSEFQELGYDAVIFPASSMRAAMGAVTRLFQNLHDTGCVQAALPEMQTRDELYELLRYKPGEEWVMPAHHL